MRGGASAQGRNVLRRRWLILGVLAGLVGVLGWARGATANWPFVVPTRADGVLYVATFAEGDARTADWQQYDGRASATLADGVLRVARNEAQAGNYARVRYRFGDFDVRVTARAEAGPVDNGFGVVFREQSAQTHYQFFISSDGYYTVTRRVDGVERVLSDWWASEAIQVGLGATNVLRVVAQGNTFRFYVNDVALPLCVADDPDAQPLPYDDACLGGAVRDVLVDGSIAHGHIGVGMRTFEVAADDFTGVVVTFDNVVVLAPR